MGYTGADYILCFLFLLIIICQIMPQHLRWCVLLIFSLAFCYWYSNSSIVMVIAVAGIAWADGLLMNRLQNKQQTYLKSISSELSREEKKVLKKKAQNKQILLLVFGILIVIGALFIFKYYNFVADTINYFTVFGGHGEAALPNMRVFEIVGVSYYTLQSVSYMADVYWGKIEYQPNPLKILMYLSFFPTFVQGPIALMSDVEDQLYSGKPIQLENIKRGYIRIIWGLAKKLIVADRLNSAVGELYDINKGYSGVFVILAAVLFTIQEYMDFSGCVDIAIGSAEIFGIKLPENFRQPFKSKNASEFWRRWHITLGVWFKTYIFYPVSVSNMAKKWNKFGRNKLNPYITRLVTMAMALFPVWLCNGIWHGPHWNYIFYGLYYFVIIMLELAMEPVGNKLCEILHVSVEAKGVTVLRIAKTWIVIFIGEMLFRATNLSEGFTMLGRLFDNSSSELLHNGGLLNIGLGVADYIALFVGVIAVAIVGALRERGMDIRGKILEAKLPIRWGIVLLLIAAITIMGTYGPGFRGIDFIYAGF